MLIAPLLAVLILDESCFRCGVCLCLATCLDGCMFIWLPFSAHLYVCLSIYMSVCLPAVVSLCRRVPSGLAPSPTRWLQHCRASTCCWQVLFTLFGQSEAGDAYMGPCATWSRSVSVSDLQPDTSSALYLGLAHTARTFYFRLSHVELDSSAPQVQ